MPWDTFAEIRTDVLDRAGKDPTATADDYYATAQRQIDRAYNERNRLVAFIASLYPSSLERHVGEEWEGE